jgi:hypothetical protein
MTSSNAIVLLLALLVLLVLGLSPTTILAELVCAAVCTTLLRGNRD